MMHRLRRYDVLRCAQYDAARFTRNDAMFAHYISEATSLASAASLVKRHHLPKANIIQKSHICPADKCGIFVFGVTGFEPAASWSRTKHSTKLSHTPKSLILYHNRDGLSISFLYNASA